MHQIVLINIILLLVAIAANSVSTRNLLSNRFSKTAANQNSGTHVDKTEQSQTTDEYEPWYWMIRSGLYSDKEFWGLITQAKQDAQLMKHLRQYCKFKYENKYNEELNGICWTMILSDPMKTHQVQQEFGEDEGLGYRSCTTTGYSLFDTQEEKTRRSISKKSVGKVSASYHNGYNHYGDRDLAGVDVFFKCEFPVL